MGRRKIIIRPILDQKLRNTTFNKRKNGLIKKAAELSMLCDLKLLLIFEDTSGSLIQYSTHNIFNQFQYFQNYLEEKIIHFTPQNYPNFFKVNHYKKNKLEEKLNEKRTIRLEKQHNLYIMKPKSKRPLQEVNQQYNILKSNDSRDKFALEPSKNESTDTRTTKDSETVEASEMNILESKNKNIKHLQINIPNKHQNINPQGNLFANIAPNLKMQSPKLLPRILSPFKANSPLLSRSAQKIGLSSGITKLPNPTNLFSFDNIIYGQNYDQGNQTLGLPNFVDPPSATSYQANNITLQQQQQQQQYQYQQQQQNNPFNIAILPQNQQMNTITNTPVNNISFFKPNNLYEAESPFPRQSCLAPKSFFPFMGTSTEEGFSPFLKNNITLDINSNQSSAVVKRDKNNFFTFKADTNVNGTNNNNINYGISSKNYEINSYMREDTLDPQHQQYQQSNYKINPYYDSRMRPRKKIKAQIMSF